MQDKFEIVEGVLKSYSGREEVVCIPEGVTEIGGRAFRGCSSLKQITISESVTKIGKYAFLSCNNLKHVHIPNWESWYQIKFESDTSNPLNNGADLYVNGKKVTEVLIPTTMKKIPDYLFCDCNSLSRVTIPEGVTEIGDCAFIGCSNLSYITIPEGITKIGDSVFGFCSRLSDITLPGSVKEIGKSIFGFCNNLRRIILSEGLIKISKNAFWDCSSLSSITIPNSVKEIGIEAFRGCASLKSITIPEGVTQIGERAFYNCKNLTSITILEDTTKIVWQDVFETHKEFIVYCPPGVFQSFPRSIKIHTLLHWIQFPQEFSEKQALGIEQFLKNEKYTMIAEFIKDNKIELLQKTLEKVTIPQKKFMEYIDLANTGKQIEVMAILLEFQWKSKESYETDYKFFI